MVSGFGFKLCGPSQRLCVPFLIPSFEPWCPGSMSKAPNGSAEGRAAITVGALSDKLPPLPPLPSGGGHKSVRPGQAFQGSMFMGLKIHFLKAICNTDGQRMEWCSALFSSYL